MDIGDLRRCEVVTSEEAEIVNTNDSIATIDGPVAIIGGTAQQGCAVVSALLGGAADIKLTRTFAPGVQDFRAWFKDQS